MLQRVDITCVLCVSPVFSEHLLHTFALFLAMLPCRKFPICHVSDATSILLTYMIVYMILYTDKSTNSFVKEANCVACIPFTKVDRHTYSLVKAQDEL